MIFSITKWKIMFYRGFSIFSDDTFSVGRISASKNSLVSASKNATTSNWLNAKNSAHNKQFWGTINPLYHINILLLESDEIMNNDYKSATVLNNYFFNETGNLKISKCSGDEQHADNNSPRVLKIIFEYMKNPSIDTIKSITTGEK